jgi:hypothetical protein
MLICVCLGLSAEESSGGMHHRLALGPLRGIQVLVTLVLELWGGRVLARELGPCGMGSVVLGPDGVATL